MCLIGWNWQPDQATALLLVANRDEFYARPTLALHWWRGQELLAGKDLQAGGSWLGVSRSGRLAAITNFRSGLAQRNDALSRGELVAAFLQGALSPARFLMQLAPRASDYNPFNLLVFDGQQLMGLESRDARVIDMAPGVGAVSNAGFQTPWPKLARLKQGLQHVTESGSADDAALLALLHDRSVAADAELPQTGIPLERERQLSAPFVASADYGTRACSVVRVGRNHIEFLEESHDASGVLGVIRLAA